MKVRAVHSFVKGRQLRAIIGDEDGEQACRFRSTRVLADEVFAAGRLTWNGRGLLAGEARRSRAGTAKVRLRLTRRARAELRASGALTTSVRLSFVSAAGDEVERVTRVTFRVAAKKGR